MRGKNAKIIHRYARVIGQKTDNSTKELWLNTPGPQRAKLRKKMKETINPNKKDQA